MKALQKTLIAIAAVATLGVVGCEKNTPSARRQADRLDKQSDQMKKEGDRAANTTEDQYDRQAGHLENKADAIRDGVTYKVTRVDETAKTVTLMADMKDKDEKVLQAGRDLTVPFADLPRYTQDDKRTGDEIAKDLKTDSKATVYFDANKQITKIDF
jgi:hypothetical protein